MDIFGSSLTFTQQQIISKCLAKMKKLNPRGHDVDQQAPTASALRSGGSPNQ